MKEMDRFDMCFLCLMYDLCYLFITSYWTWLFNGNSLLFEKLDILRNIFLLNIAFSIVRNLSLL